MKILLQTVAIGAATLGSFTMFAQVYEVGGPISFSTKNPISAPKDAVKMPEFNLVAVQEANAINAANKVGPFMFGFEHATDLTLTNSGQWTTLPSGDRIWRIRIQSPGALSLNFVFNDFYLPAGGHIHLYSPDKTFLLGAYTHQNNNANNTLGTEFIKGDDAVIEYFEPKEKIGQGRLYIGMVVHGYIDVNGWYPEKVNESGACNLDVMCPAGDPWSNEIRSVARITVGGGLCSGTLVNNTAQDGTPYFLTANHCGPQNMGNAVFRFNYNSTICGSQTAANSVAPSTNNSINGSTLKARKGDSDFGLVQLNSTPPANYNVYYAGWDNSGAVPQTAVGIHHPSGDVKKISFDDDILQSGQGMGTIANAEWRIEAWERNTTTEGGSSGSGLWDQNHRIVGQLWGGQATCANSVNDYYGKFSLSWTGNGATTSAQRLRDWLDPSNSGATTLDGWDPNTPAYAVDAQMQSILSPAGTYCNNVVAGQIVVKNNGSDPITSISFSYNVNSGTNQTYNWSGNLTAGATITVTFPSFFGPTTSGVHTFNCSITSVNGSADENAANDAMNVSYTAIPNSMPMVLNLSLDCYGSETSWEIRPQGSSSILFQNTGTYPGTEAAPVANGTQITENFCLSNGCYTLVVNDAYGDGLGGSQWNGCTVDGSYNIKDQFGNTFVTSGVADFGTTISHNFCISTVGINENNTNYVLNLFPNPSEDLIYLNLSYGESTQNLTIELLDIRGALIEQLVNDNVHAVFTTTLDVSALPQGVYFVKVSADNFQPVRKVVKN
jgi:lysyl endopeptidase